MIESTPDENQNESDSKNIESIPDEDKNDKSFSKSQPIESNVREEDKFDSKTRNSYLRFYSTFCLIGLYVLPIFFMKAQWEIWKIKMVAKGYARIHYNDGFLVDGWFDFDGSSTILDHITDFGFDIFTLIPFLFGFMGLLAVRKIISLLFTIDDRTY